MLVFSMFCLKSNKIFVIKHNYQNPTGMYFFKNYEKGSCAIEIRIQSIKERR